MSVLECTSLEEFLKVDATYYDHGDVEELHHSEIEEFVEAAQDYAEPSELLTVYAWKRQKVGALKVARWASFAIEQLLESFDEEFGDPEGEPTEPTDDQRMVMHTAISAIVSGLDVWCCDQVARYELTPAEVKELLS